MSSSEFTNDDIFKLKRLASAFKPFVAGFLVDHELFDFIEELYDRVDGIAPPRRPDDERAALARWGRERTPTDETTDLYLHGGRAAVVAGETKIKA